MISISDPEKRGERNIYIYIKMIGPFFTRKFKNKNKKMGEGGKGQSLYILPSCCFIIRRKTFLLLLRIRRWGEGEYRRCRPPRGG